jgi:hypothetical protein
LESLGARIDFLTKQLLAHSVAKAPDRNEAYLMTHRAFVGILRKWPDLTGKIDLVKTASA